MKKLLWQIVGPVVLIALIVTGGFEKILNFFIWLFMLNLTQSDVGFVGEIFVRIATFAISYTAVGILFNAIGWFNSKAMKIAYFVISTIVGFGLSYVVMLLEKHILYIVIGMGAILVALVVTAICLYCKNNKKFSKTA